MNWDQLATTIGRALSNIGSNIPGPVSISKLIPTITNLLKALSQGFIWIALIILALIIVPAGMSGEVRADLIRFFGFMLLALVILTVALAIVNGDLLYSPYERSLGDGRNYGTDILPQTRRQVTDKPTQEQVPEPPQLPSGDAA